MAIDIFNSGSGNWTVPSGVTSVVVELWGGGGGGGCGGEGSGSLGASGGGGGGYCLKTMTVTGGQSIAWSVGSGGAGFIFGISGDGNGTPGSATTVEGYTANGGGGGDWGENTPTVGASGGTASGGDTNTTGGVSADVTSGNNGSAGGTAGGTGGGAGGTGGTASAAAADGSAPGGGGGGGAKGNTGFGDGGNGAAGRVSFTYTAIVDAFNYTSSGGLILGSSSLYRYIPKFKYTSSGSLILGVPSHNVVSVYSTVGGLSAGGYNSDVSTYTVAEGSRFGGGSTVQMEYNNTTSGGITVNGSSADIAINGTGGASFGGGGTVQMIYTISKQNDLVNNTVYFGGHTKDMINVTMGGYSTLTGISTYNSTGGLIAGGKKFPGDFKIRRKIIIPADTFVESQEFYLGVKFVSSGSCLVYDSSEMLIKHELRSYCFDGGLTHIFFNADVIDPTIDNFWYLYY